jgi:hypothetical protein
LAVQFEFETTETLSSTTRFGAGQMVALLKRICSLLRGLFNLMLRAMLFVEGGRCVCFLVGRNPLQPLTLEVAVQVK